MYLGCDKPIHLDEEFKTFTSKQGDYYRVAPSVICPECNAHFSPLINRDKLKVESDKPTVDDTQKTVVGSEN